MILKVLLIISISVQIVASVIAIKLIKITKKRLAWILIAIGILFMTARRIISLFQISFDFQYNFSSPIVEEFIALVTSVLILLGVAYISPLFIKIQKVKKATQFKYRTLVETMNEGIVILNQNNLVVYTNSKFLNILGVKKNKTIRKPFYELFGNINKENIKKRLELLKKQRSKSFEISFVNNKPAAVILSPKRIFNLKGKLIGSFIITTDISKFKESEEQLLESYKHMGIVNRQITILSELDNHEWGSKQSIGDYVTELFKNITGAKKAILYLRGKSENFRLLSSAGMDSMDRINIDNIKNSHEFISLLKSGETVEGSKKEFGLNKFNIIETNYFFLAPLRIEGKTKGFILLGFKNKKSFRREDLYFYNVLASHIALTLSNAKLFRF